MRWSEQTIEQAIQTAKERNAIFVVYVEDDTQPTPTPLHNIIESSEVSSLLMNNHFVAVRIGSSDQSYRDFIAIYQLVPVPSLFFIGNNGWPLEIISGELPQSAVVQRINNLLQMAERTSESSSADPADSSADSSAKEQSSERNSSTSSITSTVTTTDLSLTPVPPQSEETEEVSRSKDRISSDPGPSTSSSTNVISDTRSDNLDPHSQYDNNTPNSSSSQNIPPSDTVNEAGVSDSSDDNKKQGKQKTSLETASSESTSPNPSSNIEDKSQPEPRRVQEHRSRLLSPQEIVGHSSNREQVPGVPQLRDSSSFLASFRGWVRSIFQPGIGTGPQTGRLMNEDSSNSYGVPSSMSHPRIYEPSTRPSGDPGYAYIQFRLPDGSTHSTSFPTQTTIQEVREYVQNNIALPFREFGLSTSYPRIEFTDEHLDATIAELGLVPRTVILIIPGTETSRPVLSSASDVLWAVITWPFSAIFSLANYMNFVLNGEPQAEIRDQSASHQQPRTTQQPSQNQNPSEQNLSNMRRRTSSSSIVQREGNVYRLSSRQDDSEDENNTWNGNSTQQM